MRLTLARCVRYAASLVVAVLVLTGLSAAPAASAAGFAISGHVDLGVVGTSAGAGDVRVAFALQGDYSLQYRADLAVLTDASGNYTISGLTAGIYSLFFDYRGTGQFSSEYWQDKALPRDAGTFPVQANVSGMNAVLGAKAFVSGTVSLGAVGSHPAGVQVKVTWERYDGYNWASGPSAGVMADASGAYSVQLGIGVYRFRYSPTTTGYQPRYWASASRALLATSVTVGSSNIVGMDVTLPVIGSISGHVNLGNSSTSAPPGSVKVSYSVCYDDGCVSSVPPTTYTDASGDFLFPSLGKGTYTLAFDYVAGSQYQRLSNVVVVVSDVQPIQSGTTVTLAPSASISGRVFLGSGTVAAAAGEVSITASNAASGIPVVVATAQTDSSGSYTIPGLRAGSYSLKYTYLGSGDYADQWWPNAPSSVGSSSIYVTTSAVSGIDATLHPGSSLSGVLKDTSGVAITGVTVIAHRFIASSWVEQATFQVNSDSSGAFLFSRLPEGIYRLEARDDRYLGQFGPQKLGSDSYRPGGMGDVVLSTGESRALGEFTLKRLGRVIGEVVCDVCAPRTNGDSLWVTAVAQSPNGEWDATTPSNTFWNYESGHFDFGPLLPGTYQLRARFSPSNGYADYVSAPFELAEGELLQNVVIHLRKPGTLTVGKVVRSSAGTAMYLVTGPNQLVQLSVATSAADFSGSSVSTASTSALTAYTIGTELLSNTVVCGATTYFAASGKLWPVTASFVAGLPQTSLDASACSALTKSAFAIPGSLFVQSIAGGSTFQIMADGSKRQVTGRAILRPGLNVLKVATSFLNSLPTGPPVQPFTVPPRPTVALAAPTAPPALSSTAPSDPRAACYSEFFAAVGASMYGQVATTSDPQALLVECLA